MSPGEEKAKSTGGEVKSPGEEVKSLETKEQGCELEGRKREILGSLRANAAKM